MHDKGRVDNIIWAGTRGMYAVELTTGSVPRVALIEAMSGKGTILKRLLEQFHTAVTWKRIGY